MGALGALDAWGTPCALGALGALAQSQACRLRQKPELAGLAQAGMCHLEEEDEGQEQEREHAAAAEGDAQGDASGRHVAFAQAQGQHRRAEQHGTPDRNANPTRPYALRTAATNERT